MSRDARGEQQRERQPRSAGANSAMHIDQQLQQLPEQRSVAYMT